MKNLIIVIFGMVLLSCSNNTEETVLKNVEKNSTDNIVYKISTSKDNFQAELKENYNLVEQNKIIKNFSAKEELELIKKSNINRSLVYLIYPTEEVIVYCYQGKNSECHIKGAVNGYYFEHDLTQVEGSNKGKITTNKADSLKTFPSEWITLNDEYIQVNMVTQVMIDSQRYTSNEPLKIYFDESGVFWR